MILRWKRTEGVGLSDADSRKNIQRYLQRNLGSSDVAHEDGKIVAAIILNIAKYAIIVNLQAAIAEKATSFGISKCLKLSGLLDTLTVSTL